MKNSAIQSDELAFLGRGWAFPPSFSHEGEDVEMVVQEEEIHQSLQILLGTMLGERIMRPQFGCDLSTMMFQEIDLWLVGRIEHMISNAMIEHEPRVGLESVDVSAHDSEAGCIVIRVQYKVHATNSRFNFVFPFYLTEASVPML